MRGPGDDDEVAPFAGAWIETGSIRAACASAGVAPFAGAWIETSSNHMHAPPKMGSRPSRARGLKLGTTVDASALAVVAPFAGAWIETKREQDQTQRGGRRALRGRVD